MSDRINQPLPEGHSKTGHETTDVNPLAIGLFGFGLGLMVAVVLPLLSWIFWRFEAAAKRTDRSQSSVSAPSTFSGPRLQERPAVDLSRFRAEENRRMSSYGWVDREQGVVRIPVERAIKILAERGLPEPRQPVKPTQEQDLKP